MYNTDDEPTAAPAYIHDDSSWHLVSNRTRCGTEELCFLLSLIAQSILDLPSMLAAAALFDGKYGGQC